MPSSTKVLGVPKEERDYLEEWSARGMRHVYTCSGPGDIQSSTTRHQGIDRTAKR